MYKGFLKGFVSSPNEYIAINSLSLLSFIKQNNIPNININGIITVNKFGIKNRDKYIMFITSIWTKFDIVNNLVNCNNHEIDIKIKKISVQDFKIWIKT